MWVFPDVVPLIHFCIASSSRIFELTIFGLIDGWIEDSLCSSSRNTKKWMR